MAGVFDCSPGWEQRYPGSAYARGVCLSVEDGVSDAATLMEIAEGTPTGISSKAWLEGISAETGRSVADLWYDPDGSKAATGGPLGLPVSVGGVPTTWWLGGGVAAAVGVFAWRKWGKGR